MKKKTVNLHKSISVETLKNLIKEGANKRDVSLRSYSICDNPEGITKLLHR